MNIQIKNVTQFNLNEILKLSVDETQKDYIEPVYQCLKDAKNCEYYVPVGLYKDNELVGFAMYGLFPDEGEEGRVWLDRFLIDSKFQQNGIGTIMLNALIEHLYAIYNCKQIFLSLYDNNKVALNLYKKFGFKFNGEFDINNEKVMVKTLY